MSSTDTAVFDLDLLAGDEVSTVGSLIPSDYPRTTQSSLTRSMAERGSSEQDKDKRQVPAATHGSDQVVRSLARGLAGRRTGCSERGRAEG